MFDAALLDLHPGDLAAGRPYVERADHERPWHDRAAIALWYRIAPWLQRMGARQSRVRAFVRRVDALAERTATLDDDALREQARKARSVLRREGFAPEPVAEVFALVREAATRVLRKRHYETQLAAGWLLLGGSLVEMATGEGKTFAATLPAVTAALAGLRVHVITVNDYLAERDAAAMAPLYRFFNLSVGAVVHGMPRPDRRARYEGDVTYVSNKELAFDYLRDRAALGNRASPLHLAVERVRGHSSRADSTVLNGLVFGIVDEADSVFIDEAQTPLILSTIVDASMQHESRDLCDAALRIGGQLSAGDDFELDATIRRIQLTLVGRERITQLDDTGNASRFVSPREREECVQRALAALHFYARDRHYVVVDDKVQIVDESTGRAMPDRAWERGLHQMIEAKEGVAITGVRETLARITYQRLFGRYLRLAGMTGTATEVAAEIGRTYGLAVMRVPLHRPSKRLNGGVHCVRDCAAKWQAVAERVERLACDEGRPVLIGTRTVKASEDLSALLAARGIPHFVLNAKQDHDEAAIVAAAGQPGRVTVATNMAGRGTDIELADGVAERGGLQVIQTEYHESPRVDRQLFGRSARHGDPGGCEAIVALDDELFVTHAPRLARWLAPAATEGRAARLAIAVLRYAAQAGAERRNRDAREAGLKQDLQLARLLAFAGRGE